MQKHTGVTKIKHILVVIFATASLIACGLAFSDENDLTIEDADLFPLKNNITARVEIDPSYQAFKALNCRLIGKEISLSISDRSYVITTAESCGWGAALGPIWIVTKRENGQPTLVLNAGGYSISSKSPMFYGMQTIEIKSETAGTQRVANYRYDGRRYQKISPPDPSPNEKFK
ncbi:hypothetical protein AB4Z48_32305 [Cupriavidus sp. 2TAF22]|uniref:hypothetical protein n=1 Tax=unclassified Cupriavidus TaxID=2640874 RepID=UPI003F9038CE